jgi:hypothetical protein
LIVFNHIVGYPILFSEPGLPDAGRARSKNP